MADEALRRDERALDLGEITPATLFWRRVRAGLPPATAGAGLGPSVVPLVYDAGGIPRNEDYQTWARTVFRPLCRTMLGRIKALGGKHEVRLTGQDVGPSDRPLESWPWIPERPLHSSGTWVDRRRAPPLVWRVRFNGRPCTVRFTGTVSDTPVEEISFIWPVSVYGRTIPDSMALAKDRMPFERIFHGVSVIYGQTTVTEEGDPEPDTDNTTAPFPWEEDDVDPNGGCAHHNISLGDDDVVRCEACGFAIQSGESVDD